VRHAPDGDGGAVFNGDVDGFLFYGFHRKVRGEGQ
jgi:hypothetical protein